MNAQINVGPELDALRESKFYLELRPFIRSLGKDYPFSETLRITELDDPMLQPADRFYFMLDFIFGDVFRNIRTRRWLKREIMATASAERIDEVGAHFLCRSYLNELVILLERLQRLIELVEKGTGDKRFAEQLDRTVLAFFNPLLCEKRNHNHHELYLGYPRSDEVSKAVEQAERSGDWSQAQRIFREALDAQITWFDHTEDAMAQFLRNFFDGAVERLKAPNGFIDPMLPANFSLTTNLRRSIRKKYKHGEIFRDSQPPPKL